MGRRAASTQILCRKDSFSDWVFGARARAAGSSGETAIDGIVKADPIRSNLEKREE
jgi:hypothetical protein